MNLLNINDAIAQGSRLIDSEVYLQGILNFEFENHSISHWPLAEREDDYASSVWLTAYTPTFGLEDDVLERWNRKRVVVYGIFNSTGESNKYDVGGYGHFSLWPAQIRARRIELFKRWQENHPASEVN